MTTESLVLCGVDVLFNCRIQLCMLSKRSFQEAASQMSAFVLADRKPTIACAGNFISESIRFKPQFTGRLRHEHVASASFFSEYLYLCAG